jgi:hypothetical protein
MSDFPNFENDDQMIGWLEEQGALSWVGLGDGGEPMFRFNMDKLKDIYPPLYKELTEEIDNDLLELYKAGLVEVEYDENLNARFKASKKAEEIFKDLPDNPFLN